MTRKGLLMILVLIFICQIKLSYAQRSIGEVKKKPKIANENVLDIPVEFQLGKKFIFLERPKELQEFGYSSFSHLAYDKFVGKVIKVIDVEEKLSDFLVTFQEEKSGTILHADPCKGFIKGIALRSAIEERAQQGQTFIIQLQQSSFLV